MRNRLNFFISLIFVYIANTGKPRVTNDKGFVYLCKGALRLQVRVLPVTYIYETNSYRFRSQR